MENETNISGSDINPVPQEPENGTKAAAHPHQYSHWLVGSFAALVVIIYLVASFFFSFWPFGNLIPALAPMSPLRSIDDPSLIQNSPEITPYDEFAGWQTYTNTEYGFEFKYPGNWDIYSEPKIPYERYVPAVFGVSVFNTDKTDIFMVTVYENKNNELLRTWYDNYLRGKEFSRGSEEEAIGPEAGIDEIKDIKLNNMEALEISGEIFNYIQKRIFFAREGLIIGISTAYPSDYSPAPKSFNQILSTFRFTK